MLASEPQRRNRLKIKHEDIIKDMKGDYKSIPRLPSLGQVLCCTCFMYVTAWSGPQTPVFTVMTVLWNPLNSSVVSTERI